MTDPTQPDEKCHCGRHSVINETLGYSRGLCDQCDLARCDACPDDCPHNLRTPSEASEGASRLLNQVRASAWEEGWSAHFHQTDTQRRDPSHAIKCDNPYRSES